MLYSMKDAFFLGGLSFRFCLTNYSATLLLLILNFPSVPLCKGRFWGRMKHYISKTYPYTLQLQTYNSHSFSSLTQSPVLDFRSLKELGLFGATFLSDLQETLLTDKDAHSSSCSCFVNGTIFDNQKSFQDYKSALAIACGISTY